MKKVSIIITILMFSFLMFGCGSSKVKQVTLQEGSNNNIKSNVEEGALSEINGVIRYMDNNGKINSIEKSINDISPYSKYIEQIFEIYNKEKSIEIPKVKVQTYIDMGTLNVSFDSAIRSIKFNSNEERKSFIDLFVQSLLSIKEKTYTDVQFYISNQINKSVFGEGYDTSSPLKR